MQYNIKASSLHLHPSQILGRWDGEGQVLLQLVLDFPGQYDVCEAFTRKHLKTIQGTRTTANKGMPHKKSAKELSALCDSLMHCVALRMSLLRFFVCYWLCSSFMLFQGIRYNADEPIPFSCCAILRLKMKLPTDRQLMCPFLQVKISVVA